MVSFSGRHYRKFIILQCVRWYVSYALSYRNIEEMMAERGFEIDHATLNRWVLHYAPLLEKKAKKYKFPIHRSWRMDETYIKIKGKWHYFYRAVDKYGATVEFMVSKRRDKVAAKAFFRKAFLSNRRPLRINIDKSGSNMAALESMHKHSAEDEIAHQRIQHKTAVLSIQEFLINQNLSQITSEMTEATGSWTEGTGLFVNAKDGSLLQRYTNYL